MEHHQSPGPSKPPSEYDTHIRNVIPFYDEFQNQVLNVITNFKPDFSRWLDTGCGTGNLILRLKTEEYIQKFLSRDSKQATKTLGEICLVDPSQEMMDIAKTKIAREFSNFEFFNYKIKFLPASGTQDISIKHGPFSIITAIQSHHYMNNASRNDAIKRCYDLLEDNGLLIVTENIRPLTDLGIKIGLDRWNDKQKLLGLGDEDIETNRARFDQKYFPITILDHLNLMKKTGFQVVELFWYSYMQAGFYAIK